MRNNCYQTFSTIIIKFLRYLTFSLSFATHGFVAHDFIDCLTVLLQCEGTHGLKGSLHSHMAHSLRLYLVPLHGDLFHGRLASSLSSRTGVFSSCCLALDSSSSFPCPAFRAIAKSAGVFSSSRTGVFSSCCLALDSSSSLLCPAFRAIAKSVCEELSWDFDEDYIESVGCF
ncbi:hypothetical protein STEG23_014296, partial [Scotinomys teguina]